jgi:U3 small nucleolar RNA-associated protein 13
VWDVPGGFCTHNFRGHTGIITLVRFHPQPRRELLFTASDDTSIRVWSLALQSCVATLTHHMSSVTGLSIADEGRTMVAVGRDQILSVWDVGSNDVTLLGTTPVYDVMEGVAVLGPDEAKAVVPTYGQGQGAGEDTAAHASSLEHKAHKTAGKSRKRPLTGTGECAASRMSRQRSCTGDAGA